jgi:imidazolonepropionase-like amidohydrolase
MTIAQRQINSNGADAAPPAWRIEAVRLPDGKTPERWWLSNRRLQQEPIENAEPLLGAYLLPGGLVDAHAHLTIDFANTGLPQGSDALIQLNWQCQQHSGVLALRDAGVTPNVWLQETRFAGRVLTTGRLLAPPGRYHAHIATWSKPDELIAAALAEVEAGASWVKVIGDFVGADGDWFNAPATYSTDLIADLVSEVHAAGARVIVHTTGPIANELVRIGVDSIEHGPGLTAESIRRMADQGTAWTPTVWTMMKNIGPALAVPGIGDYILGKVQQMQANLMLAAELGVPLLFGTDEAPHGSPYFEASVLREFGLSAEQVLQAASVTARRYLRLPIDLESSGSFVLYYEDPRQKLQTLAHPAAIVIDGVFHQPHPHN